MDHRIIDIIDCNLQNYFQILIIFVTNILDRIEHFLTFNPTSFVYLFSVFEMDGYSTYEQNFGTSRKNFCRNCQ